MKTWQRCDWRSDLEGSSRELDLHWWLGCWGLGGGVHVGPRWSTGGARGAAELQAGLSKLGFLSRAANICSTLTPASFLLVLRSSSLGSVCPPDHNKQLWTLSEITPNFVLLFSSFVVSAAAAAAAPPPRCVPSLHGQCWGDVCCLSNASLLGGTRVNVPWGFSTQVQISQVCV